MALALALLALVSVLSVWWNNFSCLKFFLPKHRWGGAAGAQDSRGGPVRGGVSDESVEGIPHLYSLLGQYRRDRHADRHRSQPHPDRTVENVHEHKKKEQTNKQKTRHIEAAEMLFETFSFPFQQFSKLRNDQFWLLVCLCFPAHAHLPAGWLVMDRLPLRWTQPTVILHRRCNCRIPAPFF